MKHVIIALVLVLTTEAQGQVYSDQTPDIDRVFLQGIGPKTREPVFHVKVPPQKKGTILQVVGVVQTTNHTLHTVGWSTGIGVYPKQGRCWKSGHDPEDMPIPQNGSNVSADRHHAVQHKVGFIPITRDLAGKKLCVTMHIMAYWGIFTPGAHLRINSGKLSVLAIP